MAWVPLMAIAGCGSETESQTPRGDQGRVITDGVGKPSPNPQQGDASNPWPTAPDSIEVTLAGRPFQLELALDDETRRRGLMFREHLDDDAGMLFVFPDERRREFWMKNCLIDLDVLFLDATGKVVMTDTMMAPIASDFGVPVDRSDSVAPAQFAIELNRGTIHQLGLEIDDTIDLPLAALKAHVQ